MPRKVLLHGLGLPFGTVGFAAIASSTPPYYASLVMFGGCFVVIRLLFAGTINRWHGF
jgi:hypothetical protein